MLEFGDGICLRQSAQIRHLDLLSALADVDGNRTLFLDRHACLRSLRNDNADRYRCIIGFSDRNTQMLILQNLSGKCQLLSCHIRNCDLNGTPEFAKAEKKTSKESQKKNENNPKLELLLLIE